MILTIAIGKKEYGQMAFNLAVTLKKHSDLPISVITDDNALKGIPEADMWVFDQIIHTTEKNPFKLKCYLNELTPYPYTIFVDADCVFLQEPNLKASLHIEGIDEPLYWATAEAIKDHYKVDTKGINTSLIAWKSNKANDKFFTAAQKAYDNPMPKYKHIGGWYPDEIPFAVAAAKKKLASPVVFHHSDKKYRLGDAKGYTVLSMNGKMSPYDPMVRHYNMITKSASLDFGLAHYPFKPSAKVFK